MDKDKKYFCLGIAVQKAIPPINRKGQINKI
jgi:hypothetical protein